MVVGVISHLQNPTFDEIRRMAQGVEAAGADWLGLPDAFWWRDTWLLCAEAAKATSRIRIGPLVTNPYLRHPFHTVSAIATLQDIAQDRVMVGIGAGGSEVSGAAHIPRADAAQRIAELIQLIRNVEAGKPLDPHSGRTLELPLRPLKVIVAGRGDRVLQTAGVHADAALLWAIPQSDLERSASVIKNAGGPELIWAPLVDHGGNSRQRVRTIAAYSVLNSRASLQMQWGVTRQQVAGIRQRLVGGGAAAAQELVPQAALDDLILSDEPKAVAERAMSIGATSIAVPAFSIDEVHDRVAWARDVLAINK